MTRHTAVALVVVAAVTAGCGVDVGGESGMDLRQMESDIETDFSSQLKEQAGGIEVGDVEVECVEKSDREARCFAEYELDGEPTREGITVTVGKDGTYIWESDGLL